MFNDASLLDLSSLLATIQKLYPQARVTSGYRGPDNPLTQAHPGSLHAQGSVEDPRAVDIAPIPGVTFGDYVNSIKQAGVPISQSFDEQKNPFPWTTGPNWHLASGGAQVPTPRKQTLADIAPPNLTPDQPQFGVDPQMQAPATLGAMINTMPQPNVPNHKGLFRGNDLAAILGIAGDALTAYGGGQPTYARSVYQRRQDEQQQAFDREKFNAQLEAARHKANEPPQFVQNLSAWLQMTPAQQHQFLQYQDAANPNTVAGPQGPQNLPRTQTKVINGKTYYSIGGEWYEEGE